MPAGESRENPNQTERFERLNRSNDRLLDECDVETFRSGGPGGQHRDRRESGVRLTHRSTGLVVTCSRTRQQQQNRTIALNRLRRAFAETIRHPLDLSRLNIPDQLEPYFKQSLRVNPDNPHHPFVVKLVLDVLAETEYRAAEAGDHLGVSTNQLVQFLIRNDLLQQVNRERSDRGHNRLQ